MSTEPVTGPLLWRDFWYYAAWWVFWCVLFATPQLYSLGREEGSWWSKVIVLGIGAVYGVVLGTLFTWAQNSLNRPRRKPVSWALAVCIAVAGSGSLEIFPP